MYEEGTLITWENFKDKYNLQNKDFFKWRQIVAAIPNDWKTKIAENPQPTPLPPSQHLQLLSRCIPIENLTSKQMYIILIHNLKKNQHPKIILI